MRHVLTFFLLLIYIIHVLRYVQYDGVPVGFFAGFSFIPPLGRQPHGPNEEEEEISEED